MIQQQASAPFSGSAQGHAVGTTLMPSLPMRKLDMREVPVCINMIDGCGEAPGCDPWYVQGCADLCSLHANALVHGRMLLLEAAVRAAGHQEASLSVPWRSNLGTLATELLVASPTAGALPLPQARPSALDSLDAHSRAMVQARSHKDASVSIDVEP